jgi:hypothetical protein
MSIKIIEEPTIHITQGDLARYRDEYNKFMQYYAGPVITLEEYIRSRRVKSPGGVVTLQNPGRGL